MLRRSQTKENLTDLALYHTSDSLDITSGVHTIVTALEQSTPTMAAINQAMARLSLTNLDTFNGESIPVLDFLEDFDRQVRLMSLEADQDKLDTLVSLLVGSAKSWYRSLQPNVKQSYTELRKSLIATYEATEQAMALQRAALYNLKQGQCQSVKEFVSQLQERARGLDVKEKDLVSIVLNGLHPQIRQHIVMAKPQSLLDILQSPAATPEFTTNGDTPPHVLVLTQQLQVMQDQMAKLTAAVNVATTTTQGQEKQVNFEPRRSQEKHHPQDKRQRSKCTERQGHAQQSRCQNCGYNYFVSQNHNCPARNAYCHNCSKRGHFATVCRAKNQNYFRPRRPSYNHRHPGPQQYYNNGQFNSYNSGPRYQGYQ